MNYASDFEGYIKNKHIYIYIIYTHIYTHNYAYVMYVYLYITIYVCNIILHKYIPCMYIQTQKSSKVKPHHPTDRSISRLWPTLPSQLVLGRVGEKSLWPTLGEPGWWVNQCHCASSSLNLPPQWIFGCMMLILVLNSQDGCCIFFAMSPIKLLKSYIKVNMDECSGWWFSQILHQLI